MPIYEVARYIGFVYDEDREIYYTRKDAIQHLFGFNDGIDDNEWVLGMNLNALPIIFEDIDQNEWRLELWNGQYGLGLSTGAEVGLYKHDPKSYHDSEYLKHYASAPKEDWIDVSFELINSETNKTILERSSHDYENYYRNEYGDYAGKDWWLTGFKLGEYTIKSNIKMNVKIKLTDDQSIRMLDGLTNSLDHVETERPFSWNYNNSIINLYWG